MTSKLIYVSKEDKKTFDESKEHFKNVPKDKLISALHDFSNNGEDYIIVRQIISKELEDRLHDQALIDATCLALESKKLICQFFRLYNYDKTSLLYQACDSIVSDDLQKLEKIKKSPEWCDKFNVMLKPVLQRFTPYRKINQVFMVKTGFTSRFEIDMEYDFKYVFRALNDVHLFCIKDKDYYCEFNFGCAIKQKTKKVDDLNLEENDGIIAFYTTRTYELIEFVEYFVSLYGSRGTFPYCSKCDLTCLKDVKLHNFTKRKYYNKSYDVPIYLIEMDCKS